GLRPQRMRTISLPERLRALLPKLIQSRIPRGRLLLTTDGLLLEELSHYRSRGARAGDTGQTESFQAEAQHALVLIKGDGPEPWLDFGSGEDDGDAPAAMRAISKTRLVPGDDQQAGLLKLRVGQQGIDVHAQPIVGRRQLHRVGAVSRRGAVGAVVGIVDLIGNDE